MLTLKPILAMLAATCGLVSFAVEIGRAAEAKPNIVLIMADDIGYDCVTANGGESYQTPNLDKLATNARPKELDRAIELATRGKAAKKKEE